MCSCSVGGMRTTDELHDVLRLPAPGPTSTSTTGTGEVWHPAACGSDNDCWLVDFLDEPSYAYLLGRYLGDGRISATRSTFTLRISSSGDRPLPATDCVHAITAVVPGVRTARLRRDGRTEVHADSVHWPCLLPHGPEGRRERLMALRPWQRRVILDREPEAFLRGLVLAPTRRPSAEGGVRRSTDLRSEGDAA